MRAPQIRHRRIGLSKQRVDGRDLRGGEILKAGRSSAGIYLNLRSEAVDVQNGVPIQATSPNVPQSSATL
jgi:hypothetical protein